MQTNLAPEYQNTPEGLEAEAILRKCVHCGFCTATCPTYQLLGDELDGPRGRIYLMKQVLEGQTPTRKTQQHLDRCLTCRNCESTCPSGVQYGHLVDIGRKLVDAKVERPVGEKLVRWALKEGLPSPLFAPAMKMGQMVRGLLPESLKAKVPAPQNAGAWPTSTHARKVLMLAGCVQPSMSPNINTATARVLDAAGIQTVTVPEAGCCGAVKFHLNDHDGGKDHMRANIDAWWPLVESGDIGALTRDLSELLPELVPLLKDKLKPEALQAAGLQAYHPPCTLQHGQQLKGGVEKHLTDLGFQIKVTANESHLCCGSAGTYSVLNPALSKQLRDRKLGHLNALEPQGVLSANIGCITHLQSGSGLPVRHWVELVDGALSA
jgi:glycolate oxidase iron-sulfur subunit